MHWPTPRPLPSTPSRNSSNPFPPSAPASSSSRAASACKQNTNRNRTWTTRANGLLSSGVYVRLPNIGALKRRCGRAAGVTGSRNPGKLIVTSSISLQTEHKQESDVDDQSEWSSELWRLCPIPHLSPRARQHPNIAFCNVAWKHLCAKRILSATCYPRMLGSAKQILVRAY